jgi:hypothetical protein
MKKIDEFRGKYYFLSNFSDDGFKIDGHFYKTNEHFFQTMKTLNENEREKVRKAETPSKAKKIGRRVTLRNNWNDLRVPIMYAGLKAKFKQNPEIKKKLVETKDAILVEGNNWNDFYWGRCKGKGENILGKLLMIIRKEIIKGSL